MSEQHSTPFTLSGEPVRFPDLAAGTAVKNAARKFETAWSLPAEAAFNLAAALVDPAATRQEIDNNDPFGNLQRIQTPAGKFLLALRAPVWTSMVSGDGGNGRSRYDIQTSGMRTRPWPIGRHHKPAVIDYHCPDLEDMTNAVRLSAGLIKSPDLQTQIARNPRGIWNPPVVVLARARVSAGATPHERWFLHTIEGSTRVEACHEMTGVDPAAPLERSHTPLEHLRETHGQLVNRFNTTPTSARSLAAARAATMPALVVVAVVEDDGETMITDGFPAVVNDYVESVHVQPRPFSPAAQNNVIGERFVLKLREDDRIPADAADAILGRSASVPGKPSVRAAMLVHAVCTPENDSLVRDFVITEANARLTKLKRAKLIGPLVVRQFDDPASSAGSALMRAFTPDLLMGVWEVTGVDSTRLREEALVDLAAGRFDTPHIAELIARGGPALCAAGLLLSDQESTVAGFSELRGHVDKVVDGLSRNAGGINVLADAVAWADGERDEKPRQFDIDGKPVTDVNGDVQHFAPEWRRGNMGIRALALNGGVYPTSSPRPGAQPPVPKSPEELYDEKQQTLIATLLRAQTILMDIYTAKDAQNRSLIERRQLGPASVYEDLPVQLNRLYARYGKTGDLFPGFNEDDLPVEDPEDDSPEAEDEDE